MNSMEENSFSCFIASCYGISLALKTTLVSDVRQLNLSPLKFT